MTLAPHAPPTTLLPPQANPRATHRAASAGSSILHAQSASAASGVEGAAGGTAGAGVPKPLLEVRGLKMHFPVREGLFLRAKRSNRAVDGLDLALASGETLGLVGESGCGKSTLGKCIVRLYRPTAGEIIFQGSDLAHASGAALKAQRRHLQMIFQDPVESLNSRHTVGDIVAEPLVIHGLGDAAWRQAKVRELLDRVGLPAGAAARFPFEFSGGQRQRIGIARAIALGPRLIVCDEPVSALDVSIQSQVLNLLLELQRDMQLSYLFIAHNLAVVKHVSDRIAIMYLGKIVELAEADEIYRHPRHPYTRALISAIPEPDPLRKKQRIVLQGDVPSPIDPPSGCAFHPRCPHATDRCKIEAPPLRETLWGAGRSGAHNGSNEGKGAPYAPAAAISHQVACHYDL